MSLLALFPFFPALSCALVTVKVDGNVAEVGYYYATLWVGTPPTKRTLLIDTGSGLTGFPCEDCQACGQHSGPHFRRTLSATSREISCSEVNCADCRNDTCHYTLKYSEGSEVSGSLTEDFVTLEKHGTALPLVFGCHDSETNLFRTQKADGVLGLSLTQASSKGYFQTLIDAYHAQGLTASTDFALCLGLQGGVLSLGGSNPGLDSTVPQSIRLLGLSHYEVSLAGLSLGLAPLIPAQIPYRTLLDSGTTFTYFQSEMYEEIWTQLRASCKGICGEEVVVPGERRPCYRHSAGPLKTFLRLFPEIYIWLDDQQVLWKPINYLYAWPDRPHDYCAAFFSSGNGENVLGSSFMRGLHLAFSRANHTLAISQSKCDIRTLSPQILRPEKETTGPSATGVFLLAAAVGIFVLLIAGSDKALETLIRL